MHFQLSPLAYLQQVFRPPVHTLRNMTHASMTLESPRGPLAVAWERDVDTGSMRLHVKVRGFLFQRAMPARNGCSSGPWPLLLGAE
jgi:hypothetical protein